METRKILLIVLLFLVVMSGGTSASTLIWNSGTMAATASGQIHANYRPELSIDGTGLDVTGLLHRNNFNINVWEANNGGAVHPGTVTGPAWVAYDLGSVVTLDSMWVWNLGLTGYTGRGLRNVTIEVSETGDSDPNSWATAWAGEFNQSLGVDNYVHETEVSFGGVVARYVVITSSSTDGSWGLTPRGIAEVRIFLFESQASNPNPLNTATEVKFKDLILGWNAGDNAVSHDVYFGTSLDDVSVTATPVSSAQSSTNYPETGSLTLDLGGTYYWRIDEFDGTNTHAGEIWSFTVMESQIPNSDITATRAGILDSGHSILNTINESGLTGLGHSSDHNDMWLDNASSPLAHPLGLPFSTWAAYEFGSEYELGAMHVWNYNQVGYSDRSLRNVRIDYSTDGIAYTHLGDFEWPQAPGAAGYVSAINTDFSGASVKHVVITAAAADGNWGGNYFGLSEVQFFLPNANASGPNPADTEVNVEANVVLSWVPGINAVTHNIYFGTSIEEVEEGAPAVSVGLTSAQFPATGSLQLSLGETYYWRAEEVNGIDIWPGEIWEFKVATFLEIDFFTDYLDTSALEAVWSDNMVDPNDGGIGLDSTAFQGISGNSMKISYSNNSGTYLTTATRVYSQGQDWAGVSGAALQLIILGGDPNNISNPDHSPLFITLTDDDVPANSATIVHPDPDISLTVDVVVWDVPLSDFSGVNMANIKSIAIGVGDGSDSGISLGELNSISVDSIMLLPVRCATQLSSSIADFDGDCLIDLEDFVFMANYWMADPITVVAINGGTVTATASSYIHENYRPVLSVDGTGLDGTGLLHRNNFSVNVWQASSGGAVHSGTVTGPTWVAYDFGTMVTLDSMWVWNLGLTGYTSRGLRNVTIEVSTTGGSSAAEWTTAWTGEFNQSLGVDNYAHETEIDLGGVDARYIVITESATDGTWGSTGSRGIAEVRFFEQKGLPADIAGDANVNTDDLVVFVVDWLTDTLWPAP